MAKDASGKNGLETLRRLRDDITRFSEQLKDIEPYWRDCFPCCHNGRCCAGATTYLSHLEWHQVKGLLSDDVATFKSAQNNVRAQCMCIFYCADASQCLVHETRPLHCRFTPYFISHRRSGPRCFIKNSDCSHFEEITPVTMIPYGRKTPFVRVRTPQNESIIYLDIMRHERFRRYLQDHEPVLLSQWLKTDPFFLA